MRIVVVDQSRTILKAVSRILESDGHVVSTFSDGREALEFIKLTPDVSTLITSAELSSISGLELCWETRLLSGRDRVIYIILMSSDQTNLINALDSGADEFMRKPPIDEELYARLRSADRLLRLQRELIRLAMTDPLTSVLNRRAFFEKAQQTLSPGAPSGSRTAIMFDVDHFKRVNDNFGHDVGDQVLRAIGHKAPDGQGAVARLGGEEFAVLLEDSDLTAGMEHAERLRAELGALSFETAKGKMSITCSFGVAEWQPDETVDKLLKRADAALYRAKESGRNRVVAAQFVEAADEARWSGLLRTDRRSSADSANELRPPLNQTDLLTWWSSNVAENMLESTNNNIGQPSGSRAFVLDDEPQIGALVCKVLQACGLAPRQFTTPEQFLAELKASPPELVVLDLSLGHFDAVEIIRHLEIDKYRGKVILVSGRDEATLNEITLIGKKHGLAMLPPLRKPFRPGDVKQRLSIHMADTVRAKHRSSEPTAALP